MAARLWRRGSGTVKDETRQVAAIGQFPRQGIFNPSACQTSWITCASVTAQKLEDEIDYTGLAKVSMAHLLDIILSLTREGRRRTMGAEMAAHFLRDTYDTISKEFERVADICRAVSLLRPREEVASSLHPRRRNQGNAT